MTLTYMNKYLDHELSPSLTMGHILVARIQHHLLKHMSVFPSIVANHVLPSCSS
jgi:hypothetical protein